MLCVFHISDIKSTSIAIFCLFNVSIVLFIVLHPSNSLSYIMLHYVSVAYINTVYNLSAELHFAISLLYRADLISITWKMPSHTDNILLVKDRNLSYFH